MTLPFALLLGLFATIVVVAIVAARRSATVRAHATEAGTPASAQMLDDAILWNRRWRIAGVIAVSVVAALTDLSGPVNPITIAAGFAVGSLLAELTRPTGRSGPRRQASLAVRHITEYVSPLVPIALVASMVVLGVVTVTATTLPGPGWNGELPADRWFVVSSLVCCGGGVAALLLARRIARHPVVHGDPALNAAQHAIRSVSMASVLGGGLISVGVGLFRVANAAALHDSEAHVIIRHTHNLAFWLVGTTTLLMGLALSFQSLQRPSRRADNPQPSIAVTT